MSGTWFGESVTWLLSCGGLESVKGTTDAMANFGNINRTLVGLLMAFATLPYVPALAHPMGNFSINHYAHIEAGMQWLQVRYVVDYAEIPTVAERNSMDRDGNGAISTLEQDAYLRRISTELVGRLKITIDGSPVPLTLGSTEMAFRPGAGGLQTLRLVFGLNARLGAQPIDIRYRVVYQDGNYPERSGWKEVLATALPGATLSQSTASVTDRSHGLTSYPVDTSMIPPQQTEASMVVSAGGGGDMGAPHANVGVTPIVPTNNTATPQDRFTQAISTTQLTGSVICMALGLAFLFGALHALSPGHGKAMVAAYLVGARGTARHAVFLGGVVTLTHTIGVFAMGVVTLAAAQYIVPERLYPYLGGLSGLAIVVIGVSLLRQRLRLARATADEAAMDGIGTDAYAEFEPPPLPDRGPISFKTLLVLGITGGALPCPSALVVMLSAIALHRIAFGLAMILAFSFGLATVLTGLGLLIVHTRGFFERMPRSVPLFARLPVFSAAVVTMVGIVLIVRALHGSF